MTRTPLPIVLGCIAAAACSGPNALIPSREAGGQLDEGGFGTPTMNNRLVQSGERSYVVDLNQRFAREVDTTITFPFDSAQLTTAARATLAAQAQWINHFPEVRFSVYGHTDLVGSDAYNRDLGRRRAQAALSYLVSLGVDRHRLEALVSLGETQPVVPVEGREPRNRRTVTEVAGFVENHPMVLDGRYAVIVYRDYAGAPSGGGGGG